MTNSVLGLVALWLTEENLDLNRGSDLQTALSRLSRTRGAGHGPRLREYTAGLTTRGVPTQLANRLAALAEITAAWEICRTHDDGDRWSHNIVKYMALGEASRILPAIRTMEARQAQGGWEPVALGILRTRYVKMLRALAAVVPIGPEVRLGIDRVRTKLRLYHLTQLQHDLDHILKDAPTLAALLVAEQRIWAHIAESKANQAKSISNKQ